GTAYEGVARKHTAFQRAQAEQAAAEQALLALMRPAVNAALIAFNQSGSFAYSFGTATTRLRYDRDGPVVEIELGTPTYRDSGAAVQVEHFSGRSESHRAFFEAMRSFFQQHLPSAGSCRVWTMISSYYMESNP
ncbi:MAG: hypothetical protein AAB467_01360, partial [Patescibacteria group bacterium]